MDLKETDILRDDGIDKHWYYRSKARAVEQLLGSYRPTKILDVGAGSGFFSKHLLANSDAQQAWCVDTSYDTETVETIAGKSASFVRQIDHVDADLVLLMDILEHVDDDQALLSEYVQKVPLDSRFLITVPAFRFLWSDHDDFLEHRRRYTIGQVESVVRAAGLDVLAGCYFFGSIFPIAASIRFAQKLNPWKGPARSQMSRHSAPVNAMLGGLCRAELSCMKMNRLAGLSVCCLAQKKSSATSGMTSGDLSERLAA